MTGRGAECVTGLCVCACVCVHCFSFPRAPLALALARYRLCRADKPLTEDCFAAMPLKFAEPVGHSIRYKDKTVNISGVLVPDSVTGTGDWMLNPIAAYGSDRVACDVDCTSTDPALGGGSAGAASACKDNHCTYHCPGCGPPTYCADHYCPSSCAASYPQYFPSGHAYVGADRAYFPDPHGLAHDYHSFAVEDSVLVPMDISAGEYVLGWRWDCEETAQIWQNCADIRIVAAGDDPAKKEEHS